MCSLFSLYVEHFISIYFRVCVFCLVLSCNSIPSMLMMIITIIIVRQAIRSCEEVETIHYKSHTHRLIIIIKRNRMEMKEQTTCTPALCTYKVHICVSAIDAVSECVCESLNRSSYSTRCDFIEMLHGKNEMRFSANTATSTTISTPRQVLHKINVKFFRWSHHSTISL